MTKPRVKKMVSFRKRHAKDSDSHDVTKEQELSKQVSIKKDEEETAENIGDLSEKDLEKNVSLLIIIVLC